MEGHKLDEAVLPPIVSACRGRMQQQFEDRTALALRRYKALDTDAAKLILREKAEVIRRSGLLKYLEPPEGGLALIGGNDAVKAHIVRDKACFTDKAGAFGIDPPRGILLTGISGCGKSAISLSAATEPEVAPPHVPKPHDVSVSAYLTAAVVVRGRVRERAGSRRPDPQQRRSRNPRLIRAAGHLP
jgi:hypothetical protein